VIEREIPNLTLYEAYQVIKPPRVELHETDRWHVMMYLAVLERIAQQDPLLVAWEEERQGLDSVSKYISRMDPL